MKYKPSLTETLRAMKVDDREFIPIGIFAYNTIRNIASTFGSENRRKYSVHIDHELGQYEIQRTK